MRDALDGAAPADTDEMLDDHGLVARHRPEDRGTHAREFVEHRDHALHRDRADHGVAERGKGMIRGAQENAAQAHEIARQREGDDLPPAIRQQFVAIGPARLQDVGAVAGLPFVDDVGQAIDGLAGGLKLRQAIDLAGRQLDEIAQLSNQSVLGVRHRPCLGWPPLQRRGRLSSVRANRGPELVWRGCPIGAGIDRTYFM